MPMSDPDSPPTAPPPAPPGVPRAHVLGGVLVALQFALIAVLAVLGAQGLQPWPPGPVVIAGAGLVLAGVGLGLAALAANRPGNFNIHPAPRRGGRLVAHGPYRYIRHPMYTAVLLLGAAAALLAASGLAALAWVALLGVLLAKARLEEHWLGAQHPAYVAYCGHTHRLLPGVY